MDFNLGSDFKINAFIGSNINERGGHNESASITALDIPGFYNLSNSASTPSVTDRNYKRRILGVLGQAEVSYKNLLFVTISARNDWSSTLPKDNNSYFYPGSTLSFVFSDLLPGSKSILSFGKLRAAYGQTGKDAGAYLIDPVFVQSSIYNPFRNLNFPINGFNAFEVSNILGNQSLQPELTTEFELGTDLRFFNGRFNIDFAYFNKNTDDQILALPIPASTGFTSQTMNLGRVNVEGVELNVGVTPVKTNNFNWALNFAYSKYESEVVELTEGLDNVFLSGFEGVGLYAKVGEPLGVFMTTPTAKTFDGKIIVDNSGLPKLDPDLEVVAQADYDYTLGISNALNYKNLSLNFTFDIRQGGAFYSRTKDILYFTGNSIETMYNNRRPFVVPNSVVEVIENGLIVGYAENTQPILAAQQDDFYNYGGFETNTSSIIDKSFVKLRTLSLSYSLPERIFTNLPVEDIRLSLIGNNLFVWTPQDNTFIDPEISSWGTDIYAKFGEFSGAPSSRTISLSIQVNF
jgi:outer membrane receptor protein involved in Fe transport